jgi:RND family efflux transporter MFP subunit
MSNGVVIGERFLRILGWIAVGIGILCVGAVVAVVLVKTAPKAPKAPPETVIPAVRVMEVVFGSVEMRLPAQGEVKAVRQTKIASEVSGKVIEVSPKFEAGEVFADGELMLRIEPADYRAAHASALSSLESARTSVELEKANGERARRDWGKLGRGDPSDLVLRKPQLASARAALVSAEAAVDKALRDLERTEIRSLYSCRIERTHIDLGATVAPGVALVDVMSLGPVEVRFSLSLEDYGYLKKDDSGRVVGEVVGMAQLGGEEKTWKGTLLRSEGFVESTTRTMNVVAKFGGEERDAPPVGMFLDGELDGRALENVVSLPRLAMVSPGRVIVVTEDSKIEFREVQVVRTTQRTVLIKGGLEAGEKVCITTLNAPVAGMVVEVSEPESDEEVSRESEQTEEGA